MFLSFVDWSFLFWSSFRSEYFCVNLTKLWRKCLGWFPRSVEAPPPPLPLKHVEFWPNFESCHCSNVFFFFLDFSHTSLILARTPNKKGRSSFKLWQFQISLAMRLSLEEKRIAHTLWLRYFVMLSSSELLCNRMTQRDTEGVGGWRGWVHFLWLSMDTQMSHVVAIWAWRGRCPKAVLFRAPRHLSPAGIAWTCCLWTMV